MKEHFPTVNDFFEFLCDVLLYAQYIEKGINGEYIYKTLLYEYNISKPLTLFKGRLINKFKIRIDGVSAF